MSPKIIVELGVCPRCGELWPACQCGKPTPPGALDTFEEPEPDDRPEPTLDEIERMPKPMPTLREWVQWRGAGGELSLYHVRLSSSGALLCGRRAPLSAAADSLTAGPKCRICERKVAELEGERS